MPIADLLLIGQELFLFRTEVDRLVRATQNRQSEIGNVLTSYQTSGSAQRSAGEPRQAGNGATVAKRACVAGKSGVWPKP